MRTLVLLLALCIMIIVATFTLAPAQQSHESIRVIRAYASDFTGWNLTLPIGTMGYELDTRKFKIGDGNTSWNSLSYVNVAPGSDGLATQAQINGLRTSDSPTFTGLNTSSTATLRTLSTNTLTATTIKSSSSGSASLAVCWKTDGQTLGFCTSQPTTTGYCASCN